MGMQLIYMAQNLHPGNCLPGVKYVSTVSESNSRDCLPEEQPVYTVI